MEMWLPVWVVGGVTAAVFIVQSFREFSAGKNSFRRMRESHTDNSPSTPLQGADFPVGANMHFAARPSFALKKSSTRTGRSAKKSDRPVTSQTR